MLLKRLTQTKALTLNVSVRAVRLAGELDRSTIFGPHLQTALMLLTKLIEDVEDLPFYLPGSYLGSK